MPQQPGATWKVPTLSQARRFCAVPFGMLAHTVKSKIQIAVHAQKGNQLFPETGLHGYTLAALGATARDNRLPALGFHTRPKAMGLRAVAPVRLECTLRHEK